MASDLTSQKIASRVKLAMYDHDPGATAATLVTGTGAVWDMRDFANFGVMAMLSVIGSSSGITKVEILAGDASDLSGNNVVVKDSGTIDADAVQDQQWLECTAAEVANLGADSGYDLRYVGARITCSNAGDEAVVTYVATGLRQEQDGNTATAIA